MRNVLFALWMLCSPYAVAQADRAQAIAEKLRCLVCQNQTIAESDAPLAQDLRSQVREQLAKGKTEDEVLAFMVARYGDFVLYQPPLKPVTWPLWFGPLVLLGAGVTILYRAVGRHAVRAREVEE